MKCGYCHWFAHLFIVACILTPLLCFWSEYLQAYLHGSSVIAWLSSISLLIFEPNTNLYTKVYITLLKGHTQTHTHIHTQTERSFIIFTEMCHQAQIYGCIFNCYCILSLFSVSICYSVFIPALLQGFTEKTEIQFAIIISSALAMLRLASTVCVCVFALGDDSNWKRVSRNNLCVYMHIFLVCW